MYEGCYVPKGSGSKDCVARFEDCPTLSCNTRHLEDNTAMGNSVREWRAGSYGLSSLYYNGCAHFKSVAGSCPFNPVDCPSYQTYASLAFKKLGELVIKGMKIENIFPTGWPRKRSQDVDTPERAEERRQINCEVLGAPHFTKLKEGDKL